MIKKSVFFLMIFVFSSFYGGFSFAKTEIMKKVGRWSEIRLINDTSDHVENILATITKKGNSLGISCIIPKRKYLVQMNVSSSFLKAFSSHHVDIFYKVKDGIERNLSAPIIDGNISIVTDDMINDFLESKDNGYVIFTLNHSLHEFRFSLDGFHEIMKDLKAYCPDTSKYITD